MKLSQIGIGLTFAAVGVSILWGLMTFIIVGMLFYCSLPASLFSEIVLLIMLPITVSACVFISIWKETNMKSF
jgi:hypothetical protein